jgi:hypothetical protein
MANHPNRGALEASESPEALVTILGRLTVSASQLLQAKAVPEEFEKARKQALRMTKLAMKSLQMMGAEKAA